MTFFGSNLNFTNAVIIEKGWFPDAPNHILLINSKVPDEDLSHKKSEEAYAFEVLAESKDKSTLNPIAKINPKHLQAAEQIEQLSKEVLEGI